MFLFTVKRTFKLIGWLILPSSDSPAASSNEIRDLLRNEKLQKLVCNIDCSADPENVSVFPGFSNI